MKKKSTVLLNPYLFAAGIGCVLVCDALCVLIIMIVNQDNSTDPEAVRIIFAVFGLAMLGSGIACLPKWFARATLTAEGIVLRIPFSKAEFRPYRSYPYIHRAWYWHGSLMPSLGYRPNFIVLTRLKLSRDELEHINMINSSSDLIIIRYRKSMFNFLCQVLPRKQAVELKLLFQGNYY